MRRAEDEESRLFAAGDFDQARGDVARFGADETAAECVDEIGERLALLARRSKDADGDPLQTEVVGDAASAREDRACALGIARDGDGDVHELIVGIEGGRSPEDGERKSKGVHNHAVLDVLLRNISARVLRDVTLTFPSSTHTAIAGPAACGASTLLALIAGTLRPESGEVLIGSRVVNRLGVSKRPLLYVTSELDVPGRWSAGHALVAAVRTRPLDREDRHHEYELAIDRWKVLPDRRIDTLSSSERTRVQLARIELLRPAILVADRVLESASPSERFTLADELYRLLRVLGTTVISTPSATEELALADRVVVLDRGRVVQQGSVNRVFEVPLSEAAALATGDINVVPVIIRGKIVESMIGAWELANPPFSGNGVALVRPDAFTIAAPGEESDFIFAVEEASFRNGAWHARGVLSGGVMLRVTFPRSTELHKGKLLPLRVERPATFLQRPPEETPSRPNGATF